MVALCKTSTRVDRSEMDFVERFSGLASGRATVPAAKLLSFTDLSPRIQSHLAQARRGCLLLPRGAPPHAARSGQFWGARFAMG